MPVPRPIKLGIVGHAADKFTRHTESIARDLVRLYVLSHNVSHIISGGCHLKGVDTYAEEIARELDIQLTVFKPASLSWSSGYKLRNLKIANESDQVLCVVVKEYPVNYKLPKFGNGLCYHCLDRNPTHVKSGGCWTAWKARRREWIII